MLGTKRAIGNKYAKTVTFYVRYASHFILKGLSGLDNPLSHTLFWYYELIIDGYHPIQDLPLLARKERGYKEDLFLWRTQRILLTLQEKLTNFKGNYKMLNEP